jgi:hypothetical protein
VVCPEVVGEKDGKRRQVTFGGSSCFSSDVVGRLLILSIVLLSISLGFFSHFRKLVARILEFFPKLEETGIHMYLQVLKKGTFFQNVTSR